MGSSVQIEVHEGIMINKANRLLSVMPKLELSILHINLVNGGRMHGI